MFSKLRYILICSILIISTSNASIFGPEEILIGTTKSLYFNPPTNPGHIFFINLRTKLSNEDLTILTFPKTPSSHPLIILSKILLNLTSYNESDPETQASIYKQCYSSGIDLCSIPEENLTSNTTIYITTLCKEKCYFELQVNYHEQRLFDIYKIIVINFIEKTSQVIKLHMPPDDKNSDHLIINARLQNSYELKEPFHIYINKGNEVPSPDLHDFQVETTWNDGKGVSIDRVSTNGSKNLCFNCNFTLMIEADANSIIEIRTETFSSIRPFNLGNRMTEIVNHNQNITFLLKVAEPGLLRLFDTEDLSFTLKPYSGHCMLYINMNSLPNKYQDYAYKIDGEFEEDFTITAMDRIKLFPSLDSIYLTVYGVTDSAFYLSVNVLFDKYRKIEFGIMETGVLQYKEIINYKFNLIDIAILNVTIDLINEIGNSDIMLKRCQNTSSCYFKYEDYTNWKNISTNDNGFLFSSNNNKDIKWHYQFTHHIQDCKQPEEDRNFFNKVFNWLGGLLSHHIEGSKICTYVIGLIADNKAYASNKYNLMLMHDQKVLDLPENKMIRSKLEMHSSDSYVFTAIPDEQMQTISFQITSISGEIIAYSSRTMPPNSSYFDQKTQFDFDAIVYKKKEGESLGGRYYLKIEAESAASYTLTTVIDRYLNAIKENNTNSNGTNDTKHLNIQNSTILNPAFSAIKLFSGITQKISYQTNYSYPTFFKLTLNYTNEELLETKEVLHMSLNPIKGKFMMFLGVNFVPNVDNFTWNSYNNSISIYPSNPLFKNPCTIYILVRNIHMKNLENYEYLLTYSTNSSIIELKSGVPLQIFFMGGDVRHYSFNLNEKKNSDFIFSKSVNGIHSDSIRVFISTNLSNIYPDESNFNMDMNESSLNITNDDKKKFCSYNCIIYITVKAYENADFSLSIKTKDSIILLNDGSPALFPISYNEEPYKLYFYPPKGQTISISSYSIYKRTNIFVNIIPLKEDSSKGLWNFPTNISYEFSSINHSSFDSSSLTLHDSYFVDKNCNQIASGCVVLLRVYSKNTSYFYSYLTNPYFSIVISSEITKLTPNIAHISTVKDKGYKYYTVYVNVNDTLFVALTPLSSGDPDLVISFGYDSRPTLDDNDWIIRSFGGENIEITPNDAKEKNKVLPGFYVIGVFGFKNCSFSLSAMVGTLKFMKIYNGNPLHLDIKPKETIYLEYFHYLHDGFKIIVVEELGNVEIYVNRKLAPDNLVESLPKPGNSSTFSWDNSKEIHKNLLNIKNTDEKFCGFCRYFIAIYARIPARATVVLEVSNYTTTLQAGKTLNDWLQPYETSRYHIFSNTGNLDVTIVAYSGDPIVNVTRSFGLDNEKVLKTLEKQKDSKLIHMRIFNEDSGLKKGGIIGISYTILVKSTNNQEVNYTILAVTSFSEKYLKYGMLDFTTLKTGESQSYIFSGYYNESLTNEINQTIAITLALSNIKEHNEESELKNEYDYFYPNVTFEILDSHDNSYKAIILKELFSGNLANFVLKAQNSKFMMKVSNPANETMNFTVMINDASFNTLLTNSENFGLVPMNHSDNYEIFHSKAGVLLIEGFECSGKIQILSTDNYDNAMNRTFDTKTVNYMENHIILWKEVSKDHLYISIKPYEVDSDFIKKFTLNINSSSNNEAYYKLSTYLLPKGSNSPYEKFYYNRQIKWLFDSNLLNIVFDTIHDSEEYNKNEYQAIEYLYALYIADDIEVLDSVIHCNSPLNTKKNSSVAYISMNYASLYFNVTSHPKNSQFHLNVSNVIRKFFNDETFHQKSLFFGIQAKLLIKGYNNYITLTFIYEPNQLFLSKAFAIAPEKITFTSENYKWIIILIVILIILIIIGGYFFRRYIIIKKKLEFEVFASKTEEITEQHQDSVNSTSKDYHGFSDEKNQTEI